MDLKLYTKINQVDKLKPLLKEIIGLTVKVPSKKVDEYKNGARELLQILSTTGD